MMLAGMMLGAGMVLEIDPGDYRADDDLPDNDMMRLCLRQVVEVFDAWDGQWALMTGTQKLPEGPWRERRVGVRTRALRRSLATLNA